MNKELPPPAVQLAIMSREYVVSRAIHAVAHLNIADHMSDQPVSANDLARLTDTVPEFLDRLLNFLSNYGLFNKTPSGYTLTPLSYPLQSNHPDSIKDVLGMFNQTWWQAFAQLETTIKTGTSAFTVQHGQDFFAFMEAHQAEKSKYEHGMNKLSSFDDQFIVQGFDFDRFKHIVDIGHNRLGLANAIKAHYPELSISQFGLLADGQINPKLAELPPADAYLFKGVLHDFNEAQVMRILGECRKNMSAGSSLIVAEQVIPETNTPHTNKTMDIIMMVLVGGQQRTLNNWIQLIESSGFTLKNTCLTQGMFTLMEFA